MVKSLLGTARLSKTRFWMVLAKIVEFAKGQNVRLLAFAHPIKSISSPSLPNFLPKFLPDFNAISSPANIINLSKKDGV